MAKTKRRRSEAPEDNLKQQDVGFKLEDNPKHRKGTLEITEDDQVFKRPKVENVRPVEQSIESKVDTIGKTGKMTIEVASVQVAEIFGTIQSASTSKKYEAALTKLWAILIPFRMAHRVAMNFIPETRSCSTEPRTLAELKWITGSFRTLFDHLKLRMMRGPSKISSVSLRFLFEALKVECSIRLLQPSPNKSFPMNCLDPIIESILLSDQDTFLDLLGFLTTDFLKPFSDIRYFVLLAVESALRMLRRNSPNRDSSIENLSHRMFLLLQCLPSSKEVEKGNFGTLNLTPDGISRLKSEDNRLYKSSFVSAWTAYLQLDSDELDLTPAVYKEILTLLPTTLLPFMSSPLRLAKFFLLGFQGSDVSVAVQALSGLFYLLVKGRLGEPQLVDREGENFYHRLLLLLQPKVFSMAVRVRFLRLLRLSLQAKMLSTEMRAMFVKKMLAVSLLTPPSASLWLLSVALRMVQSGGLAMAPLIHGDVRTEEESEDPLVPFEVPETSKVAFNDRVSFWDEFKLNGEEDRRNYFKRMSLWEIEIAKMHWYPSIQQVANLYDAEMFKVCLYSRPHIIQLVQPTASRVDPDDFISTDMSELLIHELKGLLKRVDNTPQVLPLAVDHQYISPTARRLLKLGCSR